MWHHFPAKPELPTLKHTHTTNIYIYARKVTLKLARSNNRVRHESVLRRVVEVSLNPDLDVKPAL